MELRGSSRWDSYRDTFGKTISSIAKILLLTTWLAFLPVCVFCSISPPSSTYPKTQNQSSHELPFKSSWWDSLLTECEKKPTPRVHYLNFTDNPQFTKKMRKVMYPYLLPLDHPMKKIIDEIFTRENIRIIEEKSSLEEAGFSILFDQKRSLIIVAKHPRVPGYLFKIYTDLKNVHKDGMVGWELLTTRCIVAEKIRTIIKKKKIRHFTVAEKWLYPVPPPPDDEYPTREPVILVVKDMRIYNCQKSKTAWEQTATEEHLRELYAVLGRGYGSSFLSKNVPYTKDGTFAFIDTEYNKRKIHLAHAQRFFSEPMKTYWDVLVKHKPKKLDTIPSAQ